MVRCGQNKRYKKSDYISEHSLEGLSTTDQISKIKQIHNKLGDKDIQERRDALLKKRIRIKTFKLEITKFNNCP